MSWRAVAMSLALLILCSASSAEPRPIPEGWDFAPAMKRVAVRFHGREGVVLHVGDSMTYANPYGQWARAGKGQTAQDRAALSWMHCGKDDDTDGWYLCRFDHPDGGRSYTACGGIRIDEMLAGGKSNMPRLATILDQYKPQIVVLMLGTNDASAGRPVEAYEKDMQRAVGQILDRGIICILSTIPPHPSRGELARRYNEVLRQIARTDSLPLIDYEREILTRRPTDWNGTLLGKNDVHPTAEFGGTTPTSEPTEINLRNSGYLLRGWLSVKKIEEAKASVIDTQSRKAAGESHLPDVQGTLRLPITRDVWFSDVGKEADDNTGGAPQLKLKSIQEMSLVDLDPVPLKGHVVRSATLHLKKRGDEPLHRVTVSSFAADWVEGTAGSYEKQPGSSCFKWMRYPDTPWAFAGSDLTAVMLGQGGTVWYSAEASPPDEQGWMEIPVDPAVIAARVAGVSKGFLLFDDTGSEWERDGEKFTLRVFPNRFVFSKDSNRSSAPYFTIELGPEDRDAPEAPANFKSEISDLPAGEAFVSWDTPRDHGPAGVAGFMVEANGRPVPQYLVPHPADAGARVEMHLRDLGLAPGAAVDLVVRAVDGAGNVSAPAHATVQTSAEKLAPLPGTDPPIPTGQSPLPKVGGAEIAIIDPLDKFLPDSGKMIPVQDPWYLSTNHLWTAAEKRIRLGAARNEFVSFQILARNIEKPLEAKAGFPEASLTTHFYEYRTIPTKAGGVPDPLIPNHSKLDPANAASLLCEIYVPHEIAAGKHAGTLTLTTAGETLKLEIDLNVWDFSLPDKLSFIPELNCYDLPANERDYYRLAHVNRTVIDRVPYTQRGIVEDGCAPRWDGKSLDWSAWDKRFGPLLDGSAFSDLPRKGVPLDIFYLALNENWPSPMEGNYNGSYWADRAFPPSYRRTFVEVSRQFAEHFNQKKWDRTRFLCFFNGKNNFKQHGWSHGSSPWLLDEPANFQDFWALHWFGKAFHEGVDPLAGPAQMLFRCDISRPQWQRDLMDDVLNYNVVGGEAFRRYHRVVIDRKRQFHQIVIPYGTTNDPADSNMEPVGWCLDNWTLGADGVLPWQVIGNANSWKHGDATCLFYPGGPVGSKQPIPSIRLKAYLRGEQDVEYLVLLAKHEHQSQRQLGQRVRDMLKLSGQRKGTGYTADEDAGVMEFNHFKPQDAWKLRERVGAVLSGTARTP